MTFGRFVWQELGQTLRAFARASGLAFAALTLALLALFFATSPLGDRPGVAVVVRLIAAGYYAAVPALIVGAAVAAWRHLGWTTLLPPVVLPLVTLGVFRLGGGALRGQALDLGHALADAGHRYGWPATQAVGRLAHAGPVALPFVLPAVLFDAVHLLADGGVLGSLVGLCALLAALGLGALLLTLALTAPPMAWAFVARARRRWQAAKPGAAPAAGVPSTPP